MDPTAVTVCNPVNGMTKARHHFETSFDSASADNIVAAQALPQNTSLHKSNQAVTM